MGIFKKHFDKVLITYFDYQPNTEVHGFEQKAFREYIDSRKKLVRVGRGGVFGGTKEYLQVTAQVYMLILEDTMKNHLMGTEENIFSILHYRFPELVSDYENGEGGNCAIFYEAVHNQPPRHISPTYFTLDEDGLDLRGLRVFFSSLLPSLSPLPFPSLPPPFLSLLPSSLSLLPFPSSSSLLPSLSLLPSSLSLSLSSLFLFPPSLPFFPLPLPSFPPFLPSSSSLSSLFLFPPFLFSLPSSPSLSLSSLFLFPPSLPFSSPLLPFSSLPFSSSLSLLLFPPSLPFSSSLSLSSLLPSLSPLPFPSLPCFPAFRSPSPFPPSLFSLFSLSSPYPLLPPSSFPSSTFLLFFLLPSLLSFLVRFPLIFRPTLTPPLILYHVFVPKASSFICFFLHA